MAKHNLFSMAEEAKERNHSTTYSREELMELFILENMSQQDMEKHLKRVSMEYNTLDVPRFLFGSAATIYRYFFNDTMVKRENLGQLVRPFLGRWTTVGDYVNIIDNILFINMIEGIYELATRDALRNNIKRGENIYNVLINDFKKVDITNPEYYNTLADISLKIMEGMVATCKPCAPRKATAAELKDLKLFNPNKLQAEFTKGIARLDASIKQLEKDKQAIWATVVGKLTKFVNMATNTIKDGLHVDDITQK